MLIELFVLFCVLGIIFIFLGYYTKPQTDVLKIVGYGFIFTLGILLIGFNNSGLDYHTGENILKNVTAENVTSYSITYETETYNSQFFGYWTVVLAFLGFVSIYFQYSGGRE